MVDGTEYDSVWAERTNTTYQASVLNGSFEAPDLTNYYFQEFVPEGLQACFGKPPRQMRKAVSLHTRLVRRSKMTVNTTLRSLIQAPLSTRVMQPIITSRAPQRTERSMPRSTPAPRAHCTKP